MTDGRPSNSLTLFGPQVSLNYGGFYLKWVYSVLLDRQGEYDLVHALVSQLEQTAIAAYAIDTSFEEISTARHLQKLRAWAKDGTLDAESGALSATALAPLTVIAQAIEYRQYRRICQHIAAAPSSKEGSSKLANVGGVQGFCLGFLLAIVYSCARNESHELELLQKAVNLAMIIGAAIDHQNAAESSGWTCVVVRSKSDTAHACLQVALRSTREAYISSHTDTNETSITLPSNVLADFTAYAQSMGLKVHRTTVFGPYHHKSNQYLAQRIQNICEQLPELQLPHATSICSSLRSNSDGDTISAGSLTEHALKSILQFPCEWHTTVDRSLSRDAQPRVTVIGGTDIMPKSIAASYKIEPSLPWRILNATPVPRPLLESKKSDLNHRKLRATKESTCNEGVAVIGISCRFPGAASPADFWDMIRSARSMAKLVPSDRFCASRQQRTPQRMEGRYWGNFVDDIGAFDHTFFKISPREAESMDPQQRLVLQLAYEALQTANYFAPRREPRSRSIGTFIGVTTDDYRDNIYGSKATPFSATGSLRAFITGRLNYYFGWEGPAITYDTACSSSAVAIHAACQSLLFGDCTTAIAGGVNTLTSPATWQNLAAGRFLSPTGPCRPFDADADGYCRGEGAGLVVLKKLSRAIADGDRIHAIIEASAINQCKESPSITVPSTVSQSDLYHQLLAKAERKAGDVTYIEAHGTGTPVGDPIECEGIRLAFRRSPEDTRLCIGSVKANIGHTEAASGIAGLIKTILMIHNKEVPPQANFKQLNPSIEPLKHDGLAIETVPKPWMARRRIACVNNYGAAGSCAMILVSEPMSAITASEVPTINRTQNLCRNGASKREQRSVEAWPFIISSKTPRTLVSYLQLLKRRAECTQDCTELADMTYNITMQQNQGHSFRLVSEASCFKDLITALDKGESPELQQVSPQEKARTSVVLVFGGQTSNKAYVDRNLVQQCRILKFHLDRCRSLCLRLGIPEAPDVDSRDEAHTNIVKLHVSMFAIQYSCAMAWIDCGLKVDAVIGHSFGQLTALCISGALGLEDGLRLIAGRAALIERVCLLPPGAMLAVELVDSTTETLSFVNEQAKEYSVDLACVNGPASLVFSGNADRIMTFANSLSPFHARCKPLEVTHAYHSRLMDPAIDGFYELLKTIQFNDPHIAIELTTEHKHLSIDGDMLAAHLRCPVHFYSAVTRLHSRFPHAVWLEGGSSSPVIGMVRKCLRMSHSTRLVPVDVSGDKRLGSKNLAQATCQLWNAQVSTNFWLYHYVQRSDYALVHLPPYQFARDRHWLEYKTPHIGADVSAIELGAKAPLVSALAATPVSQSGMATFTVNMRHPTFQQMTIGHEILGKGIAPASLYLEVVANALRDQSLNATGLRWSDMEIHRPLTLEGSETVFVTLKSHGRSGTHAPFTFSFESKGPVPVRYATGRVESGSCNALRTHLSETRMSFTECETRLHDRNAQIVQGPVLYKLFESVAKYEEPFKGLRTVAQVDTDVFSLISRLENQAKTICNAHALDCLVQPIGFALNCLQDSLGDEVWLCTSQGDILLDETFCDGEHGAEWLAHGSLQSDFGRSRTYQITVFNLVSQKPVAIFKAIRFTRSVRSKTRLLLHGIDRVVPSQSEDIEAPSAHGRQETLSQAQKHRVTCSDPVQIAKLLLSEATGVSAHEIPSQGELADIGVDSLVGIDLLSGIQRVCGAEMSSAELLEITTMTSLVERIAALLDLSPRTTTLTNGPIALYHDDKEESRPAGAALKNSFLTHRVRDTFESSSGTFDRLCADTGFLGFYDKIHHEQERLVCTIIINALRDLGCDLVRAQARERLLVTSASRGSERLIRRLFEILAESMVVENRDNGFFRTSEPVVEYDISNQVNLLRQNHPEYDNELQLMERVGPDLSRCIAGAKAPTEVLFRDDITRSLLEAVYRDGPMHSTASIFLQQLIIKTFAESPNAHGAQLEVLEIGAGTGATTGWVVEALKKASSGWQYTFTDVGGSLVSAARRKFAAIENMMFSVLDIDSDVPRKMLNRFDIVISTNCIHATPSLQRSLEHVRQLLQPDGVLLLVEFTKNLSWFDLVFGLFDGWWNASDGRDHPLVSELVWEESLRRAGFGWIDWTRGSSRESSLLRVIAASPSKPRSDEGSEFSTELTPVLALTRKQTVVYGEVDGLELSLDIHFPARPDPPGLRRSIALFIHGGGHVLLSRADIPPHHLNRALEHEMLPISIDYRLAPEVVLHTGSMVDVLSALSWIRSSLARLELVRPDVTPDADSVVAIGVSTGGQLAMSLGWTAPAAGKAPPSAVCVLYGPSDYHDDFWTKPNFPGKTTANMANTWGDEGLVSGLFNSPITGYRIPNELYAQDGWMASEDARARLVLWMNWHGRTVDVLVRGMPAIPLGPDQMKPFAPVDSKEISRISPLARIENGEYRTPTIFVHGDLDDVVPIAQTRRTAKALTRCDVEVRKIELGGASHLFDLTSDGLETFGWALDEAFAWIRVRL